MPEFMEKKNHPIGKALSHLTGLPVEGLCGVPVVLCKGTLELTAEGCRSILEYSDTRIRLSMGREKLTIGGEGLSLSEFHRDCLTVRGKIAMLQWEV